MTAQCCTCFRFVKADAPDTRCIEEYGDYGPLLSVEFECGKCAARGQVEGMAAAAILREKYRLVSAAGQASTDQTRGGSDG